MEIVNEVSYESICTRVFEEEQRLSKLYHQNIDLIPQKIKKISCSLPINKDAIKYFKNEDNGMSFERYISEKRDNEITANSVLQQCSQFVSYLKINMVITKDSTFDRIIDVILHHPLVPHQFFHFLRQNGLKPSTILIRLNSLFHLIQWMRMSTTNDFLKLTEILERIQIERNLYNSIASQEQKKKTLENLIISRQWVEGGLPALQKLMVDSWTYFDALVSLSLYQTLRSHQYSWCLGYTLASLWIYGVNARAQSIESMTKKSLIEIENKQFHLSSNFKTCSTYGYQIVTVTDILHIFVRYIRKQIIPEDIDSNDATLFPTFAGTPLAKGESTKKINLIFKKYGYNLTVTKLRDMLSTHLEDLFSSGKLSAEGKF